MCRTGVRAIVAAETLGRGGRQARVLEGGRPGAEPGSPFVKVAKRLPVDRQVQLIVGPMVLTSVALGLSVSPWFLAVTAFFGAGLTFAGATGTCGLARLVTKMLCNRPLAQLVEDPGSVCAAAAAGSGPTCAAPTSQGR